ncbi:MAG: family 20 glycosylhydrolase [Lentisphaeria bacterium]|nr:family 20 glycosylhydrolase [Lentisphaeria bacterium]
MKKPILLPIPKNIVYGTETIANDVLQGKIEVEFDSNLPREGYNLSVKSDGIKVVAADKAGEFYAKQTLKQLISQYSKNDCPALEIEDYPDLALRGVSLDVSRDRMPSFENLLKFVDLLASWKINTFTLYFEHVFAFKNHKKVWEKAAYLTAENIQKLDKYCQERFIELIPTQETLGHLSRWLCHEPYRQLAECPEGCYSSWRLKETDPFSICPADPKSLEFMEELLDELLPNYSSKYFFCGGDETFDIGKGRSKEACEKIGLNQVYADYFKGIGKIAQKNGKKIFIYSDMVKNDPEFLKVLPEDTILAEWGYGRHYPFKENAKKFIECGLDFIFIASNSNYSTWGGRTYRWRGNIANAVQSAMELKAKGCFFHEFGDFGHWTQFSFSLPGFAYAAAVSWNLAGNENMDIAEALDFLIYDNCSGVADLILDIGKIYNHTAAPDDNDLLYWMFYREQYEKTHEYFATLTLDDLAKASEDVLHAEYKLKRLPAVPALVRQEIMLSLQSLKFAIHTAEEFLLDENAKKFNEVNEAAQKRLAAEFEKLIDALLTHRDANYLPGGRREAMHWLRRYWYFVCGKVEFPDRFTAVIADL